MTKESNDDWDEEWGESDEEETVPCPYCGRAIYEESQRCPNCEQYISREDAPPTRRPWWIIAGTVLCCYVIYRWVLG